MMRCGVQTLWCSRAAATRQRSSLASDATVLDTCRRVFPAACNGEFDLPSHLDTVLTRGKGVEVWDHEGRAFLDFTMGWGTMLVGHAREEVVRAVQQQAPLGSNFAYVNEQSVRLAGRVQAISPCVDQLRFVASGTEACMYCERLARAFTGKPKVLKFEGAYHGATETGVTSFFPQGFLDFPTPDPTSGGIEHLIRDNVLVAPYNDIEMMERLVTTHADELAAVFVEPLHRCTPPDPGFLQALRNVTKENGVVLIFDEVVTGFRLALGGAQEYYGVQPDMVAYGKALGGGYPIGCFGGRKDIMCQVEESKIGKDPSYVWTASTLGGNPITCAAANAALDIYEQPATYPYLHSLGRHFRAELQNVLNDRGVQGFVTGDGPLAQLLLTPVFTNNYREQKKLEDGHTRREIMLGLFERGIFLNPMSTKMYLSLQHTEGHIQTLCARLDDTLRCISKGDGRR
jgi:glutamate-1-semialdehyde 2,1-aminomutase